MYKMLCCTNGGRAIAIRFIDIRQMRSVTLGTIIVLDRMGEELFVDQDYATVLALHNDWAKRISETQGSNHGN
jgi:hypothetical protein